MSVQTSKKDGVVETFVTEYDAEYADYSNIDSDIQYCDSSNVVGIMPNCEKFGPIGMGDSYVTPATLEEATIENSDDEEREVLKCKINGVESWIQMEYVNMINDVFDIDRQTFESNIEMKVNYDEYPVVYRDVESDLMAAVAPYIHTD